MLSCSAGAVRAQTRPLDLLAGQADERLGRATRPACWTLAKLVEQSRRALRTSSTARDGSRRRAIAEGFDADVRSRQPLALVLKKKP
jgi:hypothetical protein